MKKLLLVLILLFGMKNSSAMKSGSDMKKAAGTTECDRHAIFDHYYEEAKALFQDIIDGKIPDDFDDRFKASQIIVGRAQSQKLKQLFAKRLGRMGALWLPCSPIWVALEMLLESKEKGEDVTDAKLYEQRRQVFDYVVRHQPDVERLPLRLAVIPHDLHVADWDPCKQNNDSQAYLLVMGWPIHRAVQTDNLDALKIFISAGEVDRQLNLKDGHRDTKKAWTPIMYAFKFNAEKCKAFLFPFLKKEALLKGITIEKYIEWCKEQSKKK